MPSGDIFPATEASQKRQQRDARKRQRELERQAKELARLSALEQARLEVETYENSVQVLLSVHREQTPPVDWLSIASSLPPVTPIRLGFNESRARQRLAISHSPDNAGTLLDDARQRDEREYQEAMETYATRYAEWRNMTTLASRILNGDADAYIAAIENLNPFSELASIGSSLNFTVHNPRLVEVMLITNSNKAVPREVKSLTSAGKVSVKAMPKARFVEIYQDYICSCILRVARELFALLPIEALLLSASASVLDTTTGHMIERPFLSVVIPRTTLNQLNLDLIDPSDSIMAMTHRGDLKASRKTGDFEFVTPLTIKDLHPQDGPAKLPLNLAIDAVRQLRADLVKQCATLDHAPTDVSHDSGEEP